MIRFKTTDQKWPILLTAIVLFPATWPLLAQEVVIESRKSNDLHIEKMVSQIDTSVDSLFVYDYEQTKFVPPNGKSLLIMGQTVESIEEHLEHFPHQKTPGGWSAYWGIPEFKGITESYKTASGDSQNHQMLIDTFPNTVVHSALWMVGKWGVAEKAAQGHYDKVIKKFGAWAKASKRPIYLRIGYEFDGPHNELDPKTYVRAYRHIVDLLRKKGVDNIAFVWHSYASKPFNDHPLSAWYPGDEYVDWVGISVFEQAYNGTDFGPYCKTVLNLAKLRKKPVMIAESNPVRGIGENRTEVWDQWFVHFFSFVYNKNIKAVSFINEDWQRLSIPGISHWEDARLFNNERISKAWFLETNKEHYLKQSPELFELLGYSKP